MAMRLIAGDYVPAFQACALNGNPEFHFSSSAGRLTVLLFLGSGGWPICAGALDVVQDNQALFDDHRACIFGVTIDPSDVAERRILQRLPGIRWFLDYNNAVSKECGAMSDNGSPSYEPHWLLLDQMQRVIDRRSIDRGDEIMCLLRTHLDAGQDEMEAPVLVIPRIFERALCNRLIEEFEKDGGAASGFMTEQAGMTIGKIDTRFKRRSDVNIGDGPLKNDIMVRLHRFLKPMMNRAFQFNATRIERWLVAKYSSVDDGDFFKPHRDNTTKGTAHRRFACTINLNAEAYTGGDLRFPEFGQKTYRAPTGGAVVFSCSLLHEALPVTAGTRYAFLPFFYDDEGNALRKKNLVFVTPEHRATL